MSKPERLTSRAFELLTQELNEKGQDIRELKLGFGEVVSATDGDGYHDAMANLLENKKLMAEGQLYKLKELLKNSKIQEKPDQVDNIQCGHEIELEIEYSPDDVENLSVILLDASNRVLDKELENQEIQIVSPESPLGESLLGCELGQISVMEGTGARVKIIKIGIPNNLFD